MVNFTNFREGKEHLVFRGGECFPNSEFRQVLEFSFSPAEGIQLEEI